MSRPVSACPALPCPPARGSVACRCRTARCAGCGGSPPAAGGGGGGGRGGGPRRDRDGRDECRRCQDPGAHPVKRGEACAARASVKRSVRVPPLSDTTARALWVPTL